MSEPVTFRFLDGEQTWNIWDKDGTCIGTLKYYTERWDAILRIKMNDGRIFQADLGDTIWGTSIKENGSSFMVALRSLLQFVGMCVKEE